MESPKAVPVEPPKAASVEPPKAAPVESLKAPPVERKAPAAKFSAKEPKNTSQSPKPSDPEFEPEYFI